MTRIIFEALCFYVAMVAIVVFFTGFLPAIIGA